MVLNKPLGLYIHIPFCKQRCSYCDFNSHSGLEDLYDQYIKSICVEIEKSVQEQTTFSEVVSIYFGGGTPSILPTHCLEKILTTCSSLFRVSERAEITIEANPETITREKLKKLKTAGFNRLSIGAQSFDDELLKILGRKHSSKEVNKCYSYAREVGFDNINLDLIFGIPEQTIGCWNDTLEKTVGLGPDHISAYGLEVHQETVLCKQIDDGLFKVSEEDIQADMYLNCITFLSDKRMIQYELSNFAKPGKECKHNLLYWRNENYLGFGAGAHSHIDNLRFKNADNPISYIKKLKTGQDVSEKYEELSDSIALSETIFLNLRLIDGINLEEFEAKFGFKLHDVYSRQIDDLVKKELLVYHPPSGAGGENLRLTKKGLLLANQVFAEFIPD